MDSTSGSSVTVWKNFQSRLRDVAKLPYYVFANKFAGLHGFPCFLEKFYVFSDVFEFSLAKVKVFPFSRKFMHKCCTKFLHIFICAEHKKVFREHENGFLGKTENEKFVLIVLPPPLKI
jgi:hypothetical protein